MELHGEKAQLDLVQWCGPERFFPLMDMLCGWAVQPSQIKITPRLNAGSQFSMLRPPIENLSSGTPPVGLPLPPVSDEAGSSSDEDWALATLPDGAGSTALVPTSSDPMRQIVAPQVTAEGLQLMQQLLSANRY